ncbi:hypothetical protein BH11PSE14_BH11PSE14_05060 [soil metagenome]
MGPRVGAWPGDISPRRRGGPLPDDGGRTILSAMNANRFRVLALAIVLVAVLAACGNKGDLVRPAPHAVATASS